VRLCKETGGSNNNDNDNDNNNNNINDDNQQREQPCAGISPKVYMTGHVSLL